jgi:hypothetical protein
MKRLKADELITQQACSWESLLESVKEEVAGFDDAVLNL